MNTTDLKFLLDYNEWANARILDTAEKLTDVQFCAPMPKGFSAGSVRNTLWHVMNSEAMWLSRFRGSAAPTLRADDFTTVAELRATWAGVRADVRDFLDGMTDADVVRTFTYRRSDGMSFTNEIGHVMTHMIFHGMQHRAECAAMLTDFDHSPGNIDVIAFMRERGVQ